MVVLQKPKIALPDHPDHQDSPVHQDSQERMDKQDKTVQVV